VIGDVTLRNCVFCGNKPEAKSGEHILPRWLLSLTGDPSRTMHLGPFPGRAQPFMEMSFSSFRFPACKRCNERYSQLEGSAKAVFLSLLAREPLGASDFDLLMDWFDKVRVGLWLGGLMLGENPFGIDPNFRIDSRMGRKDRALIIYAAPPGQIGLRITGANTPAFACSPTCFSLAVNGLVIENISTDFLVAKHMGLPYPRGFRYLPDGSIRCRVPFISGTQRLAPRPLPLSADYRGTVVIQAVYLDYRAYEPGAYSNEYVTRMSLTPDKSLPVVCNGSESHLYPLPKASDWLPKQEFSFSDLILRVFRQTLSNQMELLRRVRLSSEIPPALRRSQRNQYAEYIKFNKGLLKRVAEDYPPS